MAHEGSACAIFIESKQALSVEMTALLSTMSLVLLASRTLVCSDGVRTRLGCHTWLVADRDGTHVPLSLEGSAPVDRYTLTLVPRKPGASTAPSVEDTERTAFGHPHCTQVSSMQRLSVIPGDVETIRPAPTIS